jgi:hypothetical protein
MNKLNKLTLAISALTTLTATANTIDSLSTAQFGKEVSKDGISSVTQKVKDSLPAYYQDANSEINFEQGLTEQKTTTGLQPIDIDSSSCVSISATHERCLTTFLQLTHTQKTSTVTLQKGESQLDKLEQQSWEIYRKRNAPTVPAPAPSEFYDRDIDGVNGGNTTANYYDFSGPNGGWVSVRANSVTIGAGDVSKKFPVLGCAVGNGNMHFYNSDMQLIGTFVGGDTTGSIRNTESTAPYTLSDFDEFLALPSSPTYGYAGNIPNYFSFSVSLGEMVRMLSLADIYTIDGSQVKPNYRSTLIVDITVDSDITRSSSRVGDYQDTSLAIWDTVCHN